MASLDVLVLKADLNSLEPRIGDFVWKRNPEEGDSACFAEVTTMRSRLAPAKHREVILGTGNGMHVITEPSGACRMIEEPSQRADQIHPSPSTANPSGMPS